MTLAFVALKALPPGAHLFPVSCFLFPGSAAALRLASDWLVDQSTTLVRWLEQMLAIQDRLAGHVVIPPAMLRDAFTGNLLLDLQGEDFRIREGRMVSDPVAAGADSGADDYDDYPPMALIVSNGAPDCPNVLLCRSNGSRLIGQELYRHAVSPRRDRIASLSPQWSALQAETVGATERLTAQVEGTHFLFVGEPGAERAAAAVDALAGRSQALLKRIGRCSRNPTGGPDAGRHGRRPRRPCGPAIRQAPPRHGLAGRQGTRRRSRCRGRDA